MSGGKIEIMSAETARKTGSRSRSAWRFRSWTRLKNVSAVWLLRCGAAGNRGAGGIEFASRQTRQGPQDPVVHVCSKRPAPGNGGGFCFKVR
jgi:hypothetical protein